VADEESEVILADVSTTCVKRLDVERGKLMRIDMWFMVGSQSKVDDTVLGLNTVSQNGNL
jgi:hypothetical protein